MGKLCFSPLPSLSQNSREQHDHGITTHNISDVGAPISIFKCVNAIKGHKSPLDEGSVYNIGVGA